MSTIAESAHNLPHITMKGEMIEGTFMRPDPITYLQSVVVLPVLILGLCIVALIFYFIALLFRFCCKCVKCKPSNVPISDDELSLLITRRKNKIISFTAFLVVIVLSDHLTFYGLSLLNSGVNHIIKAIKVLADNFDMLNGAVNRMTEASIYLNYNMMMMRTQCGGSNAGSSIASLNSGISSLSTITSVPGPVLNMFVSYLNAYLLDKKDMVYYIIYAIFMAIAILYTVAYFLRSTVLMKVLVFLSWILTLVLTIVYVIEWILLTIMGDLCYNVTNSILSYLQSGTLYNLLNYYINCEGINPFKKPYDTVANSLDAIIAIIDVTKTIDPTCAYLVGAQTGISVMKTNLAVVLTAFECSPFSLAWKEFVEVGICSDSLGGFFILWVSHIGLAWGICMSMFLSSLVWQYFEDKFWNLKSGHVQPYDEEVASFSIVTDKIDDMKD